MVMVMVLVLVLAVAWVRVVVWSAGRFQADFSAPGVSLRAALSCFAPSRQAVSALALRAGGFPSTDATPTAGMLPPHSLATAVAAEDRTALAPSGAVPCSSTGGRCSRGISVAGNCATPSRSF
ncbi:hypothetical protein [Erwinia persicina]|uniref:Secreted protein n=1 Tax=Erwinia persicina TaxID=55211 RepID=A0ABR8ZZP7_9GAMM|nr:hypothetical protein [Erwinia persicina]MBD8109204.1 hypothetical protein [Erwinia persicina]MBD8212328.1 hypothetical protein [Erwinia persicina]